MYSQDQTAELQKITKELIEEKHTEKAFEIVENLRKALRFHEYRYYVLNDPLISDSEYDQLYKLLEKIEKINPELVTAASPTQRVGSSLNASFKTVAHLVPMLSLENSYNADDLIDWDRKAREVAKKDILEYCVEPKFDGASISLIYDNDHLTRGATRGNGMEGDDITTNIKQIRSIPVNASFSTYGIQQIEIRGEIMMSKKAFKQYNDQLAEQNIPPLANPRNAASGSLRMKDPKEVGRRKLEAFLYNVSYYTRTNETVAKENEEMLHRHSGILQMLWNVGFRSPVKEMKVLQGIDAVIQYCKEFEEIRNELPYEIDGMVIKVNDLDLQEAM